MTQPLAYPVALVPDDGTILVDFPDFPEAHTFGDDKADALARAVDCLETALMLYIADRREIPTPSAARRRPLVTLSALSEAKVRLYQTMREQGTSKAELARRIGMQRPQVDRMLDLSHKSRLDQIETALGALGKRLVIQLEAV